MKLARINIAALEMEKRRERIAAAGFTLYDCDGVTLFASVKDEHGKILAWSPGASGDEAIFRLLTQDGKFQYIGKVSLDRPTEIASLLEKAISNFSAELAYEDIGGKNG